MNRLENKVAVITGGSMGIGKATAELFAREGAAVAIFDIDVEKGEAVVAEITEAGGNAVFYEQDVMKTGELPEAFARVARDMGGIDVLVNNAGGDGAFTSVIDTTEADYDFTMGLNAKSYFFCSQAAFPYLKEAEHGSIVNVSSMLSEIVWDETMAPYYASKGAVNQITRAAACAMGPYGVRVNAVLPGPVMTESGIEFAIMEDGSLEKHLARIGSNFFIGRPCYPDDIANAILFFASDDSLGASAAMLVVDGGYIAH